MKKETGDIKVLIIEDEKIAKENDLSGKILASEPIQILDAQGKIKGVYRSAVSYFRKST